MCLAALLASGCALVPVERYYHPPMASLPDQIGRRQALPWRFIPAEGEVLLVPDFRSFSSSFSSPSSYLRVFTRDNRTVEILSAKLEAADKGVTEIITLNVSKPPVPLPNQSGVWVTGTRLFFDDGAAARNIEFDRIRGAKSLVLTVRVRDGDKIIQRQFPLRRLNRREVVFIT